MDEKFRFYLVDDDPYFVEYATTLLQDARHTVVSSTSPRAALQEIPSQQPDCVVLDIMMPEMDGLELCKKLRSDPRLNRTKIVVVSAKPYEFDRRRALSFGANGYIVKPIDTKQFATELERIIEDRAELAFWGVRGTLPVPGTASTRYGGNTSCVSVEFPKGEMFVFDAGTGIKVLSDHLVATMKARIEGKIFISHPHWDHINSLPFFAPLFVAGNEFEIIGASHGDVTMRELISAQMDGVYFPIKIKEFSARVYFRDLKEETFEIGDVTVKSMLLNHPGNCMGYRIEYEGRSICYITDNEIYPESTSFHNNSYQDKLADFVRETDALITDSTYTEDEYMQKISWGHSSVIEVARLAARANVKTLYLIHHDPDQTDEDIDNKLQQARLCLESENSTVRCEAPSEKQHVRI